MPSLFSSDSSADDDSDSSDQSSVDESPIVDPYQWFKRKLPEPPVYTSSEDESESSSDDYGYDDAEDGEDSSSTEDSNNWQRKAFNRGANDTGAKPKDIRLQITGETPAGWDNEIEEYHAPDIDDEAIRRSAEHPQVIEELCERDDAAHFIETILAIEGIHLTKKAMNNAVESIIAHPGDLKLIEIIPTLIEEGARKKKAIRLACEYNKDELFGVLIEEDPQAYLEEQWIVNLIFQRKAFRVLVYILDIYEEPLVLVNRALHEKMFDQPASYDCFEGWVGNISAENGQNLFRWSRRFHGRAKPRLFKEAIKDDCVEMVKHFVDNKGIQIKPEYERLAIIEQSLAVVKDWKLPGNKANVGMCITNGYFKVLTYFFQKDFTKTYKHIRAAVIPEAVFTKELFVLLWQQCSGPKQQRAVLKWMFEQKHEGYLSHVLLKAGVDIVYACVDKEDYADLRDQVAKFINTQLDDAAVDLLTTDVDKRWALQCFMYPFPRHAVAPADLRIMKVRQYIAQSPLPDELKYTACRLGVPLNLGIRIFNTLMPTAYFQLPISLTDRYSRSAKGPLAQWAGDEMRLEAHPASVVAQVNADGTVKKDMTTWGASSGSYCNPIAAMQHMGGGGAAAAAAAAETVSEAEVAQDHDMQAVVYHSFLFYRLRMCQMMYDVCCELDLKIFTIAKPEGYPCVMMHVKKPPFRNEMSDAACEAWVEVCIDFYIAIVNYFAMNRGLSIDLLKESSFGFVTPSMAACAESMRLSVGLVPVEYMTVLVVALEALDGALHAIYTTPAIRETAVTEGAVMHSKDYETYLRSKAGFTVMPEIPPSLWDLLCFKAEAGSSGQWVMQNMIRTPYGNAWLTKELFNACYWNQPASAESLATLMMGVFHSTVCNQLILKGIGTKNITFSFDQDDDIICEEFTVDDKTPIEDTIYWQTISLIVSQIKANIAMVRSAWLPGIESIWQETLGALEKCVQTKSIDGLYAHIQVVHELMYARAIFVAHHTGQPEDCGSDSECEEDLPEGRIATKKITVHNGMNAIWVALDTAGWFVSNKIPGLQAPYKISIEGAYYEVGGKKWETWKTWSSKSPLVRADLADNPHVLLYDMQRCQTTLEIEAKLCIDEMAAFEFLVLDMTSEVWHRAAKLIPKLLHKPNGPKCILAVVSDLKGQLGSDINHHGTVRIFHKQLSEVNEAYAYISARVRQVESSVMHEHRRLNKKTGLTVSSRILFRCRALAGSEGAETGRQLDLPAPKIGDEWRAVAGNGFESYQVVQDDVFNILNTTRDKLLAVLLDKIDDDAFRSDLDLIVMQFFIDHPEHAMHSEYSKLLVESEVFKDDQPLQYFLQECVESDYCFTQFIKYLQSVTTAPLPAELLLEFARSSKLGLVIWQQDSRAASQMRLQDWVRGGDGREAEKHLLQGRDHCWYTLAPQPAPLCRPTR